MSFFNQGPFEELSSLEPIDKRKQNLTSSTAFSRLIWILRKLCNCEHEIKYQWNYLKMIRIQIKFRQSCLGHFCFFFVTRCDRVHLVAIVSKSDSPSRRGFHSWHNVGEGLTDCWSTEGRSRDKRERDLWRLQFNLKPFLKMMRSAD